jgi:hypothetical protein
VYDVNWMVGHQHIGGRGIRLLNTTAGADNTVVCESLPRYGTQPGVLGNEKGFIVHMVGTYPKCHAQVLAKSKCAKYRQVLKIACSDAG